MLYLGSKSDRLRLVELFGKTQAHSGVNNVCFFGIIIQQWDILGRRDFSNALTPHSAPANATRKSLSCSSHLSAHKISWRLWFLMINDFSQVLLPPIRFWMCYKGSLLLLPNSIFVPKDTIQMLVKPIHPLFDEQDADIILSSSDAVHFRVHQMILKLSSPFFRTMFTLPQRNENESALQVLQVPQDADTLRDLLRFWYPVIPPNPKTLDQVIAFSGAMEYYQMDECVLYLQAHLTTPEIMAGNALRAYVIAWQRGWKILVQGSICDSPEEPWRASVGPAGRAKLKWCRYQQSPKGPEACGLALGFKERRPPWRSRDKELASLLSFPWFLIWSLRLRLTSLYI